MRPFAGNFFGAFADAAVLFPLVAALSIRTGGSAAALLLSAGIAYLVSGLLFRVPMPVQPLKSIAIAALAAGASAAEIRWSGALLGGACLLLLLGRPDRLAALVPPSLVHAVQAALGGLLALQGLRFVDFGDAAQVSLVTGLVVAMTALSVWKDVPALGWVATAGLVFGLLGGGASAQTAATASASDGIRSGLVAALVLPQLALTLANSVLGTRQVARAYFGDAARRVTASRLLASIGVGNVVSAAAGGIPFCHGAGGLTAHVRGGATHWAMNLVAGGATAALGGWLWLSGAPLALEYPRPLLAALLVTTGIFHVKLSAPTWAAPEGRLKIAAAVGAALATSNLLWALGAAIALELALARVRRPRSDEKEART
jgi:hypothetical protein